MKHILLTASILLSLLTLSASAFSQKPKVDFKDNQIFVNGAVVAKMVRKSPYLGLFDFSVSGLSGPELIYVKAFRGADVWNQSTGKMDPHWFHEVNFIGSGSKATINYKTGEGIAKLIVENQLLRGNAIDPEAERRFIQLFDGFTPQPMATETVAAPTVVVNVNNGGTVAPSEVAAATRSKAPVTLEGSDILREGVVIGKFRDGVTNSNFSQSTRVVGIYNQGGEKVAEATAPAANAQEWTILILADGRQVPLLYDSPNELEKLFRWLADKGYLVNE